MTEIGEVVDENNKSLAKLMWMSANNTAAFGDVTITVSDTEAPQEEEDAQLAQWEGMLALEGKPTTDRRYLIPGEIGQRDLPLPVAASHDEQHATKTIGRIESIEYIPVGEFEREGWDLPEDTPEQAVVIWGTGTFDGSPEADDALRQLENGVGVSLDLPIEREALIDAETYEEVDPSALDGDDLMRMVFGGIPEGYLHGIAGKIGGLSLASIAAFEETTIRLVDGHALVASGSLRLVNPRPLTAAAAPLKPPTEWFSNPNFHKLTPLTITKDGRISGHLADWSGCHTGNSGVCVPPPRSASDYAYFNVGEIETENGDLIPVGKIMFSMDGGKHAPTDRYMSAAEVAQHYDDTTCVGGYVRAGSDSFGTWLAGSLRPSLSEAEIQHLRTHPPSGDWRPVQNTTELIAAFSVPIPGFPIPRAEAYLVASAGGLEVTALITAPVSEADVEEAGWRRRKRKKLMLKSRVEDVFGVRPTPRARIRQAAMDKAKDE